MIDPTVGRIVWFFPLADMLPHLTGAPLAAQIAGVNDDGTINLGVLDFTGASHAFQNVMLLPDGEPAPGDRPHAEWMPYQKGQAAKTGVAGPSAHERFAELEKSLTGKLHDFVTSIEHRLATDGAGPNGGAQPGAQAETVG